MFQGRIVKDASLLQGHRKRMKKRRVDGGLKKPREHGITGTVEGMEERFWLKKGRDSGIIN
jgi:hypothetical protein